ncbi:NfeD family protein, partial [Saccharopolyspora elongata]
MVALLWLIAGVVLIGAEVISGELVLLMLGLAAIGAAGAAALGVPLGVDAAVFALLGL